MRWTFIPIIVVLLAGCSSTGGSTSTPSAADSIRRIEPRLTFGYTSSGLGSRPSDAIRLDSSGQMTFTTRSRVAGEEFKEVTGMAFLEDRDYSDLLAIVKRGDLTNLDPDDIGVKCPQGQGEMISLVMRMTDQATTRNLVFDECALEYNLLLEMQRIAFKDLINWFNFMRKKYRPYRP